jgi:hypothetical protein
MRGGLKSLLYSNVITNMNENEEMAIVLQRIKADASEVNAMYQMETE